MGNKIAFMGVGAVGGYAGAHMVQAGEDVTFISGSCRKAARTGPT